MASFNRVIILGNLTKDVELRHTTGGTAVTDVGVAVNDRRKKGEEWVDEVSFFDITLWGRNAEVAAEFLGKGSPALFEGKLKQDRWQAEDGTNRTKVHIIAEKLQLLGKSSSERQSEPVGAGVVKDDDDIPFGTPNF
jgi:single-strand DNA-binding protein